MPRKQRMYLPGVPAHVVQRGNNRNACFFRMKTISFIWALFFGHLEPDVINVMREVSAHNYSLGNDRFRESIAMQLGRSVGYRDSGRPVVKNK